MKKSFVNAIVSLVLLVESLCAPEVYETVEAVVGHGAELPCNISAENENDTLAILAWYKNESSKAFYSHDQRSGKGVVSSTSPRYKLVKSESEGLDKLQILSVRPADAGMYICSADFASSPTIKTHIKLIVIEPPQRLWVGSENGTRVETTTGGANTSKNIGPYYIGDMVNLFCIAYGGSPQSWVSWRAGGRSLPAAWFPLSAQRVRGDVRYGPLAREDHGALLTCSANNNRRTPPLYIDLVINMYLPPELISLRGPVGQELSGGRVRAGDPLSLQCRVLGARPPPPVRWRLGDTHLVNLQQNITTEASQRLVVSEIQLTIDRRHDEMQITCCAPTYRRADHEYVCAQALPLTVLYPPALEIVGPEEMNNRTLAVVKGSNLSLTCRYKANPSIYHLTWFHEENEIPDDGKSSQIKSTLEILNVTEADAGEYACAATNNEGTAYSEPVIIDVTFSAYCEDETLAQYGVRENETVNITCGVRSNPKPHQYQWVVVNAAVEDVTQLRHHPNTTKITDEPYLSYERPNNTPFSTVFCWGLKDFPESGLEHSPCISLVTAGTAPRPPTECRAVTNKYSEITINCEKGHDGGLPQTFKFIVKSTSTEDQYLSITSLEPNFVIEKPKTDDYVFLISAFNEKGESTTVEIDKSSIIEENLGMVANITALALALCGGVALVALAACGLVLCARERDRRDRPVYADPPLCAYNTEESNCETFHGSDDGSDCNIRRTDSFRRAVSRYPSRNYDVRRTSSFHSAKYINDATDEALSNCNEGIRHTASCRVHSLQNINKKKDMDVLCDHLVMHLPTDASYSVPAPRPMNTFYTMPRKMRHKLAKELSDEMSEITQNSDGFSLPPPPDEFSSYRAGARIKDMPTKSPPTYSTIRKNSVKETPRQYNNVIISPMNTVGLPTISGQHPSVYTYPEDQQQGTQTATAILSTFKSYSSPNESGL